MQKQLKQDLLIGPFTNPSERIKFTPKSLTRVIWISGLRGQGLCIPKSKKVIQALREFGLIGIEYKDGIPFFSPCKVARVTITITENRNHNFHQCDILCAKKWNSELFEGKNNWTAASVADWRKSYKYTWHEQNDMQTCELIPTVIHAYFGHLGGVGEVKRKNRYLANFFH